jgi:hypothetical protein
LPRRLYLSQHLARFCAPLAFGPVAQQGGGVAAEHPPGRIDDLARGHERQRRGAD